MALEGYALRTAIREANRTRGTRGWLHFIPPRPRPELPVLLLEDSGALVGLTLALLGVGLTVVTGNGVFDGIASLCIGALLATIAVLLARETTSLLIGEAAVPEQINKIHAALLAAAGVDRVIHLRTVHLGPTNSSSPARSACLARPTAPTSPPPSTTPNPASAKPYRPRGSSTSNPTSTARSPWPAKRRHRRDQHRHADAAGRPRPLPDGCTDGHHGWPPH
jgi:hypothetical protein